MIPKKEKKEKVVTVVAPKGFILVTDCDMGTICAIRVSLIGKVCDSISIEGNVETFIRFVDEGFKPMNVREGINVVLARMAKAGVV